MCHTPVTLIKSTYLLTLQPLKIFAVLHVFPVPIISHVMISFGGCLEECLPCSNAHCCSTESLSWAKPCCRIRTLQSNGKANWDWSEPRRAEAVQSLLSSRPVSAATATAPSASVLELTSSSPCPPELVGENFLSTNRLTLLLHPLPHRASGASVGASSPVVVVGTVTSH